MASFFGRKDFGDPRNNFGRPREPLDRPSSFPGQSSWPAYRLGEVKEAPGLFGLFGGGANEPAEKQKPPLSARSDRPQPIGLVRSSSPTPRRRTPSPAATPRSARPGSARSSTSGRNSARSYGTSSSFASPRAHHIHPGVAELMRLGFPRPAAEKAFAIAAAEPATPGRRARASSAGPDFDRIEFLESPSPHRSSSRPSSRQA